MKYLRGFFKKQADQTDIEDSYHPPVKPRKKQKRRRVPKYLQQLKRLKRAANYIVNVGKTQKIMRFRAKNLHKTLRVYCYDEDVLNWPYRFTKKVNTMVCDNDRDSDEQIIQEDKNRCLKSLFEAIQQRRNQKQNRVE